MTNEIKIGEKIKKMRELKGIKQADMAERLEMTQGGYSRIELENTDVPFSRLLQIAKVLGVSLVDLVGFEQEKMMLHITNSHNQGGAFTNDITTIAQEINKIHEARIADLKQEILYLRGLLDKALLK
jgi:transcriptional regulator with XRE-family HTH domain